MVAVTAKADSKAKANKQKTKKQRQEQLATDSIDIRRTTISPLDILEILTQVGFFLPTCVPNPRGEDFGDGDLSPFLDRAQDALSCMLISKHWHEVMIPILWYTCLAAQARVVPTQTLLRFISHIRILEVYTLGLLTMPFNRLVGLSITMPSISKWSTTHCRDLYVRFVRANPGLKSLSWDGSVANFVSILDPKDFAGLDQLQSLTLH